jgi:hypothetical protein
MMMLNAEKLTVAEDSALTPAEKGVNMTAVRKDEKFTIHSEIASVTRFLLRHPAFRERNRRVIDGEIVAVTGYIPIGMVDLKPKPRQSNQFGRITSSSTLRGQSDD